MEKISSNKTIAKNTLFLYGRMLFNLVVSLYTSRVILQVLGVEDLGVYQVVAGIVAMFTFVNGSLAGATSRFLAFELGKNDSQRLARTFAATLNVHIVTAAIFFVVCETIGLWLVNYKLNIPAGREVAANVVYQASILMTMLSLVQSPYNAAIIAHERMKVFAYVGILDTLFKLLACYVLYITPYDRLMVYGAALLTFTVVINLIYYIYCRRSFTECRFRWSADWSISKPILVFSGWELIGDFSLIAKNQGVNILLNIFYGVAVNAACGFANIVYGAISGFSNNFMVSVRPAITKSYSMNDFGRLNDLINQASKFSFALILLLTVPVIFDGNYIFYLWLRNPPEYTVIFSRFTLLTLIIAVLFSPIAYAINATGKNKYISLLHGPALLCILPITYFALKGNGRPYTPFLITLVVELVCFNIFPFLLKIVLAEFQLGHYYRKTILPCCVVISLVFAAVFLANKFILFGNPFLQLLFVIIISSMCICLFSYRLLLSAEERKIILQKLVSLKRR